MTPAEFIGNPNWADFLPEFREPARKRHLPAHEDCSSLEGESVGAHLMVGGTLGRLPNYEERPGQLEMLRAIVRAYNAREHLMVEAGTGVGKSLAYLIPSILWAWTNDTPVVISTATRNLQSQLISSDIPKALEILGEHADDFKVALVKGRQNYACLRMINEFFAAGEWTMTVEEQAELPHFIAWLTTTPDGDLDRYEGYPRTLLTCPGEECAGRKCPYYARCFVYRARKNAADAHLIIANHALVLADATSASGGILPAYGRLVFDEAHNLEDIATEYLSDEFSVPALQRVLKRLTRLLKTEELAVPHHIARILDAAEDVMLLAEKLLKPVKGAETLRYRVRDGVRAFSVQGLFQPYEKEAWREADLMKAQTRLDTEFAGLITYLHTLREDLEASAARGECVRGAELAARFAGIAEMIVGFANELNFVLKGEKETHAYWVERMHPEKRAPYVRLVAAPLSIADDLHALLYETKESVILSSATLRVGNDFKYMAKRLGCQMLNPQTDGRYRALIAASPFNYFQQALVLAPDCLPDPAADPIKYAAGLAIFLKDLFKVTQGRALVLFTSYEMMQAVAAQIRYELAETNITLLVQGDGLSRESMTEALKTSATCATAGTVLFGAQSFWEGVDIAGEALSCVVIARLPFAMVGDPVVEARSEKLAREGNNAFRDYALPEAVIKFRQGFGRLIRSKRDRGVVVITDPRIVTKNYGQVFRQSIPSSVHTVTELPDLLHRVTDFFA